MLPMIHRLLHLPDSTSSAVLTTAKSLHTSAGTRGTDAAVPVPSPSPKAPRMTRVPSILDRHLTTAMRALSPVPNGRVWLTAIAGKMLAHALQCSRCLLQWLLEPHRRYPLVFVEVTPLDFTNTS